MKQQWRNMRCTQKQAADMLRMLDNLREIAYRCSFKADPYLDKYAPIWEKIALFRLRSLLVIAAMDDGAEPVLDLSPERPEKAPPRLVNVESGV